MLLLYAAFPALAIQFAVAVFAAISVTIAKVSSKKDGNAVTQQWEEVLNSLLSGVVVCVSYIVSSCDTHF